MLIYIFLKTGGADGCGRAECKKFHILAPKGALEIQMFVCLSVPLCFKAPKNPKSTPQAPPKH